MHTTIYNTEVYLLYNNYYILESEHVITDDNPSYNVHTVSGLE